MKRCYLVQWKNINTSTNPRDYLIGYWLTKRSNANDHPISASGQTRARTSFELSSSTQKSRCFTSSACSCVSAAVISSIAFFTWGLWSRDFLRAVLGSRPHVLLEIR